MWDQRYNSEEYAYGTAPNSFLAQHADSLAGPVLSLAEGEGRNAVFLATLGLQVTGVDGSAVGLAKARKLAHSKGVTIETLVADLAHYEPPEECYRSVVSISAHLPGDVRARLYPLIERSLKPGGIFLLEEYTKDQIPRGTGGPRDPDRMTSSVDLENAFPNCDIVLSRQIEREVTEGIYHSGMASVVQFIAKKKA
ncbi:MAG: SAM-dependent methyltransferase [Verrucomicrobiota bacterium JB025]|nr:class I SAM-dependent methyltransferase [Verrucomicrobiota bacterium JB025]